MNCDVAVVGGGPAGLAFVRSLAGTGLSVALVERQPHARLAAPADDGREIALTHRSVATLQALGAWAQLRDGDVAPLREAQVFDGASPFALSFGGHGSGDERLGQLVPNHRIRAVLFDAIDGQAGLRLLAGIGVDNVEVTRTGVRLSLSDGRTLVARLLVGADSRFSTVRDKLGIAAEITPLDRSMLVCRVAHERDHRGVATEWFDHGHTIAMLPLNGRMSSAVLTLPAAEIDRIAVLDADRLGAEITRRYGARLGAMRVAGRAYVYPLTITYARHFAARRAALIGDAAVGMHPVTAHGFNLGLQGQATLSSLITDAARRGGDITSPLLLRHYEAAHRLATRPLYAATNMIVGLYTDDRPPARLFRHVTLRAAARLPLIRPSISRLLTQR